MYDDALVCQACEQALVWAGCWTTVGDDARASCLHVPRRSGGVYQRQARSGPTSSWDIPMDTLVWGSEHREQEWVERENTRLGWERYRIIKLRAL